jgi:penicillin-binding protein 2
MSHRVGYDAIAPVAKMLGLGQEFDLPGSAQRYGTIPDAAWKMRRYGQEWSAADSLNASIGQGYVSVSPLQLAVMTARIASGRNLTPSLIFGKPKPPGPTLPFTPEQLSVTHDGMFRVVNGSGTGTRSRLDLGDIKMAGKTGTAQVRAMISRGSVSDWKSRDHSLFVCYAPTDTPRYAMAVVVEHGTFGARAAAPIAKDCMTFLFDPGKAWDSLLAMEKGWGGTPTERMAAKYAAFTAQYGSGAPTAAASVQATEPPPSEPAQPTAQETPTPRPAPVAKASPAPAPTPSPSPIASTRPEP